MWGLASTHAYLVPSEFKTRERGSQALKSRDNRYPILNEVDGLQFLKVPESRRDRSQQVK